MNQGTLSLPGLPPPPPPAGLGPVAGGEARKIVSRWSPIECAHTVVTAEVYKRDVIFKVSSGSRPAPAKPPKPRGVIRGFSAASRKRLRLLVRNTSDMWTGFVTVTYPADFPMDGATAKRHVHALCSWFRRQKVAYVWILEFQERGAPHFHFLVSGWIPRDRWERDGEPCKPHAPGAVIVSEGLESRWAAIVGSGDPNHVKAGTRVEGVKNPDEVGIYMSKYMTKLDQKTVPEGFERVGRFWGASRCLTKVLYRMRGLYRDVAAHNLAPLVTLNQDIRRQWAERMQAEAEAQEDPTKRANLEARAMSYAEPWEWKGYGFMVIGGAAAFRSILRQAVEIDKGADVWREWKGEPESRPKYLSPRDRLRLVGQLRLDGGFEAAFPEVY